MKTQLTLFQIIILGMFAMFAVGGMIYFARGQYGGGSDQVGPVLIWGTLDERAFSAALRTLADNDNRLLSVQYEQYDPRTFYATLADAIASDKGPDLIIFEHEYITRDQAKVIPFSFESVSERAFLEQFADGTEIFWTPDGALGVPIAVDPMVLYVNKDLLASGGFSQPPQSWNEVFDIAEKVTKKDDAKSIVQSGIAFGEYQNVTHAKEIISTLMMQAGSPITTRDAEGRARVAINMSLTDVSQPAQSALRYYTEFANPAKIVYSWNRSLPESRVAFGQGDVGLYVGFASEYPILRAQNPNLDFTAAMLPQVQGASRAVTFGRMYAFAVPRGSLNPDGARSAALILANKDASRVIATATGIPSARRDVLAEAVDGSEAIFRDSAIIARGWYDPDPSRSGRAFQGMIEDATSGSSRLSEAVQRAERELTALFNL